jgi:hypothetical protein
VHFSNALTSSLKEKQMKTETLEIFRLVQPQINPRITDDVFVGIETIPEARTLYNGMCASNSVPAVNAYIGRTVKTYFSLGNSGSGLDPRSSLIKTFTLH